MTYRGPNSSLTLQPHSDDIFGDNLHPDLDALIELKFRACDASELSLNNTGLNEDEPASPMRLKLISGLMFGVPLLSYVIYKAITALTP